MMQKEKTEHNEKALILYSPFLYYRRKDAYWPAHTLENTFLAVVLMASFFVFRYWLALPFAIIILLLLELPRWLDKPRCLATLYVSRISLGRAVRNGTLPGG